jgi:hypothetical protein
MFVTLQHVFVLTTVYLRFSALRHLCQYIYYLNLEFFYFERHDMTFNEAYFTKVFIDKYMRNTTKQGFTSNTFFMLKTSTIVFTPLVLNIATHIQCTA